MEEVFLDGLNVQFHCLLFCRICVSYMLHISHRTPKVDWTFIKIFFLQHCVDSFNINTNKWVLRSVNIISSTEPVPWILLVLTMSKASLVEYSVTKLPPPLPSSIQRSFWAGSTWRCGGSDKATNLAVFELASDAGMFDVCQGSAFFLKLDPSQR